MKQFIVASILVGSVAWANQKYYSNDGVNAPESFSEKSVAIEAEEAEPVSGTTGVDRAVGPSADQMNTSPNPAPTSDKQVIDNSTTLTKEHTEEYSPVLRKPSKLEAQEEGPLDYSTTPKKK